MIKCKCGTEFPESLGKFGCPNCLGEPTRGGARKGAGRKARKTPRQALTLRVEPEIAKKFARLCEGKERSQSEQFSEMVDFFSSGRI